MADLLIEIGCEDLPSRFVEPLSKTLQETLHAGLAETGLTGPGSVSTRFGTPRRLAVLITDLAETQAAQKVERKGPKLAAALKDGQPTPAGLGFARSCGVAFEALEQVDGQLVLRRTEPGRSAAELIPGLFEAALKKMDEVVPKRMRWGASDATFVRPVHWIVALLGPAIVPIEQFGLRSGRITYGHRFHAPQAIELAGPADYLPSLIQAKVEPQENLRRTLIEAQVHALAGTLGGTARLTQALIAEVAALVEWPVALAGRIEERFLELPPEVIVSTVETNQRYFTVFAADGKTLLPHFITVANIESADVSQVISGNERVVRPRLSDALFFWRQDLRRPLAENVAELDAITYQKELGSVGDKVRRLHTLSLWIAGRLGVDSNTCSTAATLCKADLVSKMVYEFPELQGIMGGYYALDSGCGEAVASAIREHYLPTQQGTPIPSTPAGRVVALADKLDTLAGIFAIGQKPTASKDPFGLRRAALGVLRITIEGGLDLDLLLALAEALKLQPQAGRLNATLDELLSFFVERLRGYCLEAGATAEQFEAVRATGASHPLDFTLRLAALKAFDGSAAAQSLAAADKRARNILRQAGIVAGAGAVDSPRFETPAEQALLDELERVEAALLPLRQRADYAAMLAELAALKAPVDAFFDSVMVMADDPAVRANRLALLARLDGVCREVADLSLLPG